MFIDRPYIISVSPEIATPVGEIDLTLELNHIWNSEFLGCKIGPFWSEVVTFINQTHIICQMPKQAFSDGDVVQVSVTLNGIEIASIDFEEDVKEITLVDIPIAVDINPLIVFFGEKDIEVTITAIGIFNSRFLSCKAGNLLINGIYNYDPVEDTYTVKCTLPSESFVN